MKKYILGLFLIFVVFFSVSHNAFALKRLCRKSSDCTFALSDSTCAHGGCGCSFDEGGDSHSGVLKSVISPGGNGFELACQETIAVQQPVKLDVEAMSPVPQIPHTYTFGSYLVAPYPFTQLSGSQPVLPSSDPVTVGHKDPSGGNSGFFTPTDISSIYNSFYNPVESTVLMSVGSSFVHGTSSDIAGSVSWPTESLFDNLTFWNKPIAYSFRVTEPFLNYSPTPTTVIAAPLPQSKWYPLNFFTASDPTSKINSLSPIPINITWAQVPGAVKYEFKLNAIDNPFNLTNTGFPVDVQITNPRSYNFSGNSSVSYDWSVIPLNIVNGVDTPMVGDQIIKAPVGIFFPANIHGPTPNQPYSFAYDHYEYGWDKIPGAVRYEIQYALAFHPIPNSTPFSDGATFQENTKDSFGNPGGLVNETTYVLSSTLNNTPGLNFNDDLGWQANVFQYKYFHYDFTSSILAGIHSSIPFKGLSWRVQGIDANGNIIHQNLIQSGYIQIPLSKTPYQSAYLSWPLVPSLFPVLPEYSTSYIVDIVQDPADFSKLPYLTSSEVPILEKTSIQTKIGSTSASTSQSENKSLDANNVFLLRRVIPDYRSTAYHSGYDAGNVTVNKFIKLLREARVYEGKINYSVGQYEIDSTTGEAPIDEVQFDSDARTYTNNFTNFSQQQLDGYYPLVTNDLGMTMSSPTSNQLKLVTNTTINVIDKSTGNAKLIVTQSNGKKNTIITFTTQAGAPGEYAFDITKNVNISTNVIHSLTYDTFGPMPVIGDLTNKDYAEFDKLLPNQTYYWRQRCMKDPQIFNPLSAAAAAAPFTFCPWSAVQSFTTSFGLPASIDTVGTLLDSTPTIGTLSQSVKFKDLNLKLDVAPLTTTQPLSSKNLAWNDTPTATSYNIEVYLSSDITKAPIKTLTGITTTSAELKSLQPGVRYYLVIRGVNQYGIGPKIPVYSFIAETVPSASVIVPTKK